VGEQRPRVQNPDAQTFPQLPQLFGSVGRSTQLPAQLVNPSLQTNPQQLPPSQLGLAAAKQTLVALSGASSHSLSHSPQNLKSVAKAPGWGGSGRRLKQPFRHCVKPGLHVKSQEPCAHTALASSGGWHSFPHEPQFWVLVERLSQVPPHAFVPEGHPQRLFALSRQASPRDVAQQASPQAVLPSGQEAQAQSAWLQWEFPVQTQLCEPLVKIHLGSEQLVSARSGDGGVMYEDSDAAISTPINRASLTSWREWGS
jgi:hypothetical protein